MNVRVLLSALLLPVSRLVAESGSDDMDDEPDPPQLRCFVKFRDRGETERMSCELSEPPALGDNITLTVSCPSSHGEEEATEQCLVLGPAHGCSVPIAGFSLLCSCCIGALRPGAAPHGPCVLRQKITHMVKPAAPFNLRVIILMEAEEVQVTWDVPTIRFTELFKGLIHQVSYWSADSAQQQVNVTVHSLRLLMKNLVANSQYMVQVRSSPNQQYFKGVWSDWSEPVTFTIPSIMSSTGIKVTLSMSLLLFLFLIGLVALLWESRIKPYIWPRIPNPKKALEQLYTNPNKAIEVSFDPDYFLDVTESRVDMMTVKGAWPWHCYPYPPPPTETAGDHSTDSERKLLMQSELEAEDGPGSAPGQAQQSAEELSEHGDPQDEWAQSSVPVCLSPTPLTQEPSPGGAAHVPDHEGQSETLSCPCTQIPAPHSDESYITMSNLYKTQ